jgi:beta-lactamase superfamily II metal-dependent hydrolase
MPEDFAINVDFAVLRGADKNPRTVLAWGDPVRMVSRSATQIEVEVVEWVTQADGSLKPRTTSGFLKRTIRVDGKNRQVALPAAEVAVLRISFVDVQQGDGTLIQTPNGRVITLDGGENQLFARFLAGRLRGTSAANRQEIEAMVVTHGDADHFAGLTEIQETETQVGLRDDKRLFVHPKRVFHNGLVKRPGDPGLKSFGATVKSGDTTVVTGLESDLLAVPASEMNKFFKAWRRALLAWSKAAPIEFKRLAKGDTSAFDFLAGEKIDIEVLGPIEVQVGGKPGLPFLSGPSDGVPMAHLNFKPGTPSASHTVNGHSIVLRLHFGNFRMLFAGDLNNAAEELLTKEHKAKKIDLSAEVFKVPHHGSHEFTSDFLKAVSPLVSVVSSGDESARKEYIHPRATLMNALGRYSRDDTGLVFVTEMVAFFEMVGQAVATAKPKAGAKPESFFGFRRTAFGCVRVRTDGNHLLVFTDTGKRDLKEVYAYDASQPGVTRPGDVRKA